MWKDIDFYEYFKQEYVECLKQFWAICQFFWRRPESKLHHDSLLVCCVTKLTVVPFCRGLCFSNVCTYILLHENLLLALGGHYWTLKQVTCLIKSTKWLVSWKCQKPKIRELLLYCRSLWLVYEIIWYWQVSIIFKFRRRILLWNLQSCCWKWAEILST